MEANLPTAPPGEAPREEESFPYSNWGPLPAITGVVIALVAVSLLAVPVQIVDNPSGDEFSTSAQVALQLLTALGFLVVPFVIAMQFDASVRVAARRLGLRSFRPSALGWMLAAAGAYLVFGAIYVAIVGEPEQEDIAEGFGAVPVQVLLIVVAAPISEEVCFRGMLFGGLRERLPLPAAALASGAIFGVLHALTGLSAVPPLIVFGFILALLYEQTGSIVPGILLHMLNNSVALLGQ
jgi:membrane protease YdiL (CAAX protease family)